MNYSRRKAIETRSIHRIPSTWREGTIAMTARGMGSCLLLAGALSVTACGLGRSEPVSTVTIEMVCNTTAECPNGFECILDSEHGPPMRLCESSDPAAVCPVGYETKRSEERRVGK